MTSDVSSYLRAYERDDKLRRFCDEWLRGAQTGGADIEQEARIAQLAEQNPDAALRCAVSLVELAKDKVENATLAGPFAFLLAKFGPEYVDVVCELSRVLPRMARILGCVSNPQIPKSVMRKLGALRTG